MGGGVKRIEQHCAVIRVDPEFLRLLLGLPDDARIFNVEMDWSAGGVIDVMVEDKRLPITYRGDVLPHDNLCVTTRESGTWRPATIMNRIAFFESNPEARWVLADELRAAK